MTRINVVLMLVLIACALSLVSARFSTRHLTGDLENAVAQARKLEIDWNQLQLDQASLSKHTLIEAAARKELGMQAVAPGKTQYLTVTVHSGVSLHDTPGAGDAQ